MPEYADPLEVLRRAREERARAELQFREALRAAIDYRNVTAREIAEAAGLTRQRVFQMRKAER